MLWKFYLQFYGSVLKKKTVVLPAKYVNVINDFEYVDAQPDILYTYEYLL